MKTFYTILLLLISANLFAQDDSVDSIKISVRKAPSIVDDADNPRYSNSDSNKIVIVDGVVTTNPINDSIENNDFPKRICPPDRWFNQEVIIVDGVITTDPKRNPEHYNWFISHSAGIAPEESEGTFYVSISTRVGRGLFLGLRGGIYTFRSPLDSAVNDTIRSKGPYSAGNYSYRGEFVTQGPSYIGALFGSFHIARSFSLSGSAGVRVYSEDTWEGLLGFYVVNYTTNYSFGPVDPRNSLRIISSENVIKPYFSIGADYKAGRFLIGVFGDNVFSFGANVGIGFN